MNENENEKNLEEAELYISERLEKKGKLILDSIEKSKKAKEKEEPNNSKANNINTHDER